MQMYLHLITTVSVAIKHVAHTGNSFYYALSRYRLLQYNAVHDKCKICQSNIRTWNTAAEFVWTVSNKVVIKAVFQWTKNNDRSCVVHCNSNQPQYISPYKHAVVFFVKYWQLVSRVASD